MENTPYLCTQKTNNIIIHLKKINQDYDKGKKQ